MSIAPVRLSRTPSTKNFTDPAASRPAPRVPGPAARAAAPTASRTSTIPSAPPKASMSSLRRARTTRAVSAPRSATARYAAAGAGPTMASCQPTIPRPWSSAWASRIACSRVAWSYGGMSRATSSIACSWSIPTGVPSGSRSIRPLAGIRGRGGDPGELQGARVHPGAVSVTVGEEDGPVGDDRVERLAAGDAAGECLHRPAVADDPLAIRVGGGVGGDGREVVLGRGGPVEVALDAAEPARGRMALGIGEPGGDRPASEVDHPGPWAAGREDVAVRPEGRHAVTRDGDRRWCRAVDVRAHRPDSAAMEDQVRGRVAHAEHARSGEAGGGYSPAMSTTVHLLHAGYAATIASAAAVVLVRDGDAAHRGRPRDGRPALADPRPARGAWASRPRP